MAERLFGEDLLDIVDGRTTLITVNRRLARTLRAAFDRGRMESGTRVWESPDILPYAAWLQRCWMDYAASGDDAMPALLGPEQDLALWEQVIEEGDPGYLGLPLLQTGAAARNAQAAWALLRAWRLHPDDDLGFSGEDTRVFRAWAREYANRCKRSGWADSASIGEYLLERLDRLTANGLRRMLLAGFDTLTPQQEAIMDGFRRLGVQVDSWRPAPRAAIAQRVGFANPDDELAAAARWARQRVEEGAAGPIGVIVPALTTLRDSVERVFEERLSPGATRPGSGEHASVFNISLGQTLSRVPVVNDALVCLQAMRGRLSLRDAGRLLLSPYVGGGDRSLRARFDAELRRVGEPQWSLGKLRALARSPETATPEADAGSESHAGTSFAAILDAWLAGAAGLPRRQSVSRWAVAFSVWLDAAGWPGDRPLDSNEYQAVRAFRELIATFAGLAPVLPVMNVYQGLGRIQRLAARQVFQPRSDPSAVQILGILEAAGLGYSDLWITGLHAGAWPEPPRPNPFLPSRLQRELAMPRAGSEQQLSWSRAWTGRMLASADRVIVSYPRQMGEEPLQPSALISHLPLAESDNLPLAVTPSDAWHVHGAAPMLETILDVSAPPVDQSRPVRGGVSVLKDQAACPFRAFAVHRLGADDVSTPASSLDARVRGNLAHRLLELLWRDLETRDRLLAMSEADLEKLIRASVARILEDEARQRPHTLRGRLLAMEQDRLEALANAWLALEAERAPFEVIAEQSDAVSLAGLSLELRPDRVDRISDGDTFLVDYKTGRGERGEWFGERPGEPQLPLYAVAFDDRDDAQVAGIAYAMLRPGELGFRGLGGVANLAPGVETVDETRMRVAKEARDWDELKTLWRERLTALAHSYLSGDARVDPKHPGVTCRYCGMQALCRVYERKR